MKKNMTVLTVFLMCGLAGAFSLFAGPAGETPEKALDSIYTETQRKAIYKELAAAEQRAADEVGPILASGTVEQAMTEQRRLQEKYRTEVLQKHSLTQAQEVQLNMEALTHHWDQG